MLSNIKYRYLFIVNDMGYFYRIKLFFIRHSEAIAKNLRCFANNPSVLFRSPAPLTGSKEPHPSPLLLGEGTVYFSPLWGGVSRSDEGVIAWNYKSVVLYPVIKVTFRLSFSFLISHKNSCFLLGFFISTL